MPNPQLIKAARSAVLAAGAAMLAGWMFSWLCDANFDDVEATRRALVMVTVGLSLAAMVTGWSAAAARAQTGGLALLRAFAVAGLLGLAACCLAPTVATQAVAALLNAAIGLAMAAGILATCLSMRENDGAPRAARWIALLPAFAGIAAIAAAALVPATGLAWAVPAIHGGALLACAAAGMLTCLRAQHEDMEEPSWLLAAAAVGVLAEGLLLVPAGASPLHQFAGETCRIGSAVLAYCWLFHQMARAPLMQLQRAEATLRIEQERLARARQIAKLGSWEWRLDTNAVWTSEEVRQMFGIAPDKAGMTRAEFEALLYREDVPRLRAAAAATIGSDAPYSVRYRIHGAEGAARTMHSEAQVERDESGKALRLVGIVQDITERVAVEHALRESDAQMRRMNVELEQRVAQRTRQLAAANNELEAFSYSVSHDLQAPLRRIERYAELLSESNGSRIDEAGRDMLRRIQEASTQTKQLIASVLKLSQLTRVELHRVVVDLSALAKRVVEQIERAASPPRQVEVSIDPGIVVEADQDMLRILLDNLLGNAWKFTSRTERPSIRVGAVSTAEGGGFYVSDNGAGFDMRYAHKLFGAFQRLHTQSEFGGTGIGLAIVQRIVNVHGWQIQASSEAGRGATFTVTAH